MSRRPNFKGAALFPRRLGVIRVYAVGFDDGSVKFGQSKCPSQRIGQLARSLRRRAVWAHLIGQQFQRYSDAYFVELRAVAAAGLIGRRRGSTEVVDGISREDAIACLRAAVAARPSEPEAKPAQEAA